MRVFSAKIYIQLLFPCLVYSTIPRLYPWLDVWLWPQGRNSLWIYVCVTLAVVLLDVLEIRRRLDTGDIPVHVLQPSIQFWVPMPYIPDHELEMLLVYRVKSHQRRVKLDVYLRRLCCAEYEGSRGFCCHLLESIQRLEDDSAILFVVFLGVCEAGFVDAVVEVGHHPAVHFINFSSQLGWIGVKLSSVIALGQMVVVCVVQHAHYIFTLIVHNLICLLVP